MKKALLVLLSVVIVGYLAWRWFAPTAAAPTPVQRSNPKPTAAARSTRTKQVAQQGVAKPAPARPVTSQPRLAPEGTFFLLQRASLPLDSGVSGFAPVTKATMVEQSDSASTVPDGQYHFTVQSSQLT